MMFIKFMRIILLLAMVNQLVSCSPKNISTKYYYQNEKQLDKIEETYKELSAQHPFTIAFTARNFKTVAVEIITDTISYIYEFGVHEPRLADTLTAYGLKASKVITLIHQMQSIRCTWIKKCDYYVDEEKQSLIFMSIKPVALKAPFAYSKYYVLTYFTQPQYFDEEGNLLDKKQLRRLRKINGEIFKRINSKVCYTISGKFR
jgi:hypothetical protein